MTERVIELKSLHKMDPGAPLPAIKVHGADLLVFYICSNSGFLGWGSGAPPDHPGFEEYCAVLKFSDVERHYFGKPNDEKLHEHPLYDKGLTFYGFHIVEGSTEIKRPKAKYFIITFHDETLEVVAKDLEVVSKKVDTSSPKEAIEIMSEQMRGAAGVKTAVLRKNRAE